MNFGSNYVNNIPSKSILAASILLIAFLNPILSANSALTTTNTTSAPGYLGQSSWGSGIMVPNGARFANGGTLTWSSVTNITALVQLPNINQTDAAILVIVSVMISDGTVLQLAAGLYPNSQIWQGYAWVVTNVNSISQTYKWILNASNPEIPPDGLISLSIFLSSSSGWSFQIENLLSRANKEGTFSITNESSKASSGDQEVFALESYSFENSEFAGMDNLTLRSLVINGQILSSGWYFYGGWDSIHSPLFVVGSTGPPSFVSYESLGNGTCTWNYVEQWSGTSIPVPEWILELVVFLAVAGSLIAVVFLVPSVRHAFKL